MSKADTSPGGRTDKSDVWNKVLRTALAMPGARVNRASYLRKELSAHVPPEMVELAITKTPAKAGISPILVKKIAASSIAWHRTGVTTASFAAGLPGGWWMAATIPGDLTQFFWHVSVILQKLAYIHGWPELLREDQELDDETLHLFTIFVGVMFGTAGAGKLLSDLAERLSKQIAARLPRSVIFAGLRFSHC